MQIVRLVGISKSLTFINHFLKPLMGHNVSKEHTNMIQGPALQPTFSGFGYSNLDYKCL